MRFTRNQSGVAAIEFAMLAPVAIALVCGVCSAASTMLFDADVAQAANKAARLVQTSRVSPTVDGFGRALCDNLVVKSCDGITFTVRALDDIYLLTARFSPVFVGYHDMKTTVAVRVEQCGSLGRCLDQ